MNGIHWEGDIAFLLQGDKIQTAFDFEVPCPFDIVKGNCNHRIDLRQAVTSSRLPARDPLVRAMSPVPKTPGEPAAFFADSDLNIILATLARMSSPLKLPIAPLWSLSPQKIIRELGSTNVQPLVLTGVRSIDRKDLDRVLEASPLLPRRLVLLGRSDVVLRPEAIRLDHTLGEVNIADFVSLPWEGYGAHLLKQHMLKQGSI